MRKHKCKWARVYVSMKRPDRPLTEDEQLASLMGFVKVEWTTVDKTIWCDLRRRLTSDTLGRAFAEADKWVADQNAERRGCFGIPEVEYSDEPFLTGRVI